MGEFNRKPFISLEGILNYGAHKGKHISELPDGYIAWAGENVPDFTARFQSLMQKTPEGVEKLVYLASLNENSSIQSSCGTGRIYNKGLEAPTGKKFISRSKRPKNWSEPQTNKENGTNPTTTESPL